MASNGADQPCSAHSTHSVSSPVAVPDFPRGHSVPFPFPNPYPQQVDFMDTLLSSLPRASPRTTACCPVYMMESPTGTGKSLSLACAAMAWLRHVEHVDLTEGAARDTAGTDTVTSTTSGLDWVNDWVSPEQAQTETAVQAVRRAATDARRQLVETLDEIRQSIQIGDDTAASKDEQRHRHRTRRENVARGAVTRQRHEYGTTRPRKKPTGTPNDSRPDVDSDTEHDTTAQSNTRRTRAQQLLHGAALDGSLALSIPTRSIRDTYRSKAALVPVIGHVAPGSGVRKVIYAARTHSQLSQFIGELRRTAWGTSIRVVHLGGRAALCGNAAVRRGATERAMTEHCLDLQKGLGPTESNSTTTRVGTKKRGGNVSKCPWLHARDAAIPTLALQLLAEPTDIEEAAALGQASHSCAYYASRAAIAAAEVVVLPYSMLLSPPTRESIGLSLHQSLVIVDEAHNLPEALRSLHACRLTLPVIVAALGQLTWYTTKYGDRLAGRNLFYLGQIRRILLSFQKYLQTTKSEQQVAGMMTATELLMARKLDNINLFEIMRYLEQSRLSQKLLGFVSTSDVNPASAAPNLSNETLSKHVSAMSIFETFLEKLTSTGTEGKVVTDWPVSPLNTDEGARSHRVTVPALRYVLIQPAAFFENVLRQASALALVGGTLRPFVHVATELLGSDHESMLELASEADRRTAHIRPGGSHAFVTPTFTAFTCDHVVPSSNVLLQCLARGATGQSLDFRYKQRSTTAVCDELGQSLLQICRTVPCGVVIFLPSYSYEARLVERWKTTGLWQTLQAVKKVHREPKSSQHVEASLQVYARDATQGAVLFSIVGGKMSEGINFSDDMARCVVVVGLPYPDITDPELKEKMTTLDGSHTKAVTGQDYYHNLCMRAVNQSVGRAIRHANDYAALILIDKRYTSDSRVWSGLSNWLKRGNGTTWREDLSFDQRLKEIKSFFANKEKTIETIDS